MQSFGAMWRILVAAFLCLSQAQTEALAAPEMVREPPRDLLLAIADAPSPSQPRTVVIGAYVNDVQEVDMPTHSYSVDLYIWLRWSETESDPSQSLEFMNRVAPNDHVRELLYDKPKAMPDGSLYTVIRTQGRFSNKFQLERYPFDTQELTVAMEDTVSDAGSMVYVADTSAVTINPEIVLPGFKIGQPMLRIVSKPYPTDFGDLSEPVAPAYSRATIAIPISRPLVTLAAKTFTPILLILMCAGLVLFVRPGAVDGRIGLAITALLTLVALQLTSGASLPDVDYLLMIDKIYFLSYVFVFTVLVRTAATSWVEAQTAEEDAVARSDKRWAIALSVVYAGCVGAVLAMTLTQTS